MAIGPVQLILLGFEHPEFHGEIVAELERLKAGGYRVSDGFISPLDLVEIGLLSSEEAQELHGAETRRQPA
jgi:hypothetical protein